MEELAYGSEETVFGNESMVADEARELAGNVEWFQERNREAFEHLCNFLKDLEAIKLNDERGYSEVGRMTAKHSLEVGRIAHDIASSWLRDPEAADLALTGGVAHDIGKIPIGIRHPYLLDPTRIYDDEDRAIMAKHSELGYNDLVAYGQQFDFDFSKEGAVIALHHVPKRQTEINSGRKLSTPQWVALQSARSKGTANTGLRIRRATLAVALADTYHAITDREYVPSLHLPKKSSKREAVNWTIDNIDASRLGLTLGDSLGAARALVRYMETEGDETIPDKPSFSRGDLPRPRRGLGRRIGHNLLSLF